MVRRYPEPDPASDEPLQFVSYWSDERLIDEAKFLSVLYAHVLGEIEHRAQHCPQDSHIGSAERCLARHRHEVEAQIEQYLTNPQPTSECW